MQAQEVEKTIVLCTSSGQGIHNPALSDFSHERSSKLNRMPKYGNVRASVCPTDSDLVHCVIHLLKF